MSVGVRTHLMYEGNAEEAMNFYVSLFPDAEVLSAVRYEVGDSKGKLQVGTFVLAGREFICIDSPIPHEFSFTPSVSIFVDFDSLEELGRVLAALSDGGEALMPLDDYGFSTQFAWINDRFGLCWQLNLP